jgi:putative CocE/NonD family hydrolase
MPGPGLYDVLVTRNVLIPLSDGVELAGDLFLPDSAGPFPALVQYYPYDKDDVIGSQFDHPNRYFAARGYASLLVDLRGLGGSSGVAWELSDRREGDDGAQVVEWAAAQEWCDGNVGMWGVSYGGSTTLQTAARRPPHLRAIAPMNSNGGADPYWRTSPGGCLTCLSWLGNWGPWMLAMSLLPPLYEDPDGRWSRVWDERLKGLPPPFVFPLQEHPTHDAYWDEKVIAVDEIDAPAFFWAAWRDQLPGAMTDAFTRVRGPRKLLVGPWMHWMPDLAAFEQVDYLAELTRWWDRWLKGQSNGIEEEPPVTIYVQGAGWRHEREWPLSEAEPSTFFFAADRALSPEAPRQESLITYRVDPTVGVTAGLWDPAGTGLGMPFDQGPDDRRSLTFTSAPVGSDMEITGGPEATLRIALDEAEDMHIVVKLCDVSPAGDSQLITSGWLKATHYLSHKQSVPLVRGEFSSFQVPLVPASYRVPTGHRLRVAVSGADFPRVWPTAANPLIRLAVGGFHPSSIRLPVVVSTGVSGPALQRPDPSVQRTPLEIENVPRYRIDYDFATETVTVTTGLRASLFTPSRDGRFEMDRTARAVVSAARPDAARVEGEAIITCHTPGGSVVVAEGRSWVSLTGQTYSGRVTLDGLVIFDRRWER